MMGGLGSGYWYRSNSKETTGSQRRIEVSYLKKHNCLLPGTRGSLSWSIRGKLSGNVYFSIESNGLRLNYWQPQNEGKWESIEQFIGFAYTDCNYGGQRVWLLCRSCSNRVGILYGADKYFICRQCSNLGYQSQLESHVQRQIDKSYKARKKLGGIEGVEQIIPDKPKGLHWKTYFKLYQEILKGDKVFNDL